MRVGVLGELVVSDGVRDVVVPAGHQRVVLAALALQANRTMSVDELADVLWDGRPPGSAGVTLRNYVRRLRGVLGNPAAERIVTQSSGYLLRLDEDEFDASSVERLLRLATAAAAAGRRADALRWAAEARTLWRGAPLTGVHSESLQRQHGERLRQLRLRTLEQDIECALQVGRHREVIADLFTLARDHPLNERFHAQLVLALYRAGRRGEAVDVYARARAVLREELGVEPGPALHTVYQQMLAGDPALDAPTTPTVVGRPDEVPVVVPRQLPPAPRHFAGRMEELAALTGWSASSGAVVISAIGGMGGIGKTALAVTWAHQSAAEFPDGQLYVNLRGYGPQAAPLPAEDALRGFLDVLGVPPTAIPSSLDAQVALYRSLVADRRVLVVLDNARDAEHVRPLLPGSATCMAIVTSRSTLMSLVAAEGARHLSLDVLDAAAARDLIERHIGGERLDDEADAVDELIELCSGLPLALSIVGARAATTPRHRLATLVDDVRAGHRLDPFDAGDPATDVRAVFLWSYRTLDDTARRVFRLLALHPGPDASVAAVVRLIGLAERACRATLDELRRAYLITQRPDGRIAMHDLLASFAAERVDADEPPEQVEAARRRLLTWYLRTAVAASRRVNHRRTQRDAEPGPLDHPPLSFDTYDDALRWLEGERTVLIAAVSDASSHGLPEIAAKLPLAMLEMFQLRHYWDDWRDTHTIGVTAVAATGDWETEAILHTSMGNLCMATGRMEAALTHLDIATDIRRGQGEAVPPDVVGTIGNIYIALGQIPAAVTYLRRSRQLYHEQDNVDGEAAALNNLGWALQIDGQIDEAAELFRQAIDLSRRTGNAIYEGAGLSNYGGALWRLGRTADATTVLDHAVALNRQTGNRTEEANAMATLGHVAFAAGDYEQARRLWDAARATFAALSHPRIAEVDDALAGCGAVDATTGR
jgi:DNA-binding SARP family transcriptional activator/Tfp pilus assembly protein PilF